MQELLNKIIDNKKVFGTSYCLKYKGDTWCGASGNLNTHSQYYIASTTKLFVSAIILNLKSKGKLDLDDKIAKYLDVDVLNRLHVFKGEDFSNEISVKNILAHTSGLPDYFEQKDQEGKSLHSKITNGEDRYWTFEDALDITRAGKPLFQPGSKGRAHYSDTNFQLLGQIIERISGKSLSDVLNEIIYKPLNLTQTYIYKDIQDNNPKPLYFRNRELNIPKAMSSFGPDGGMVSTSSEMIIFLDAFFNGLIFPKQYIENMKVWNKIFFPVESGIGFHRFNLPWVFNPFGKIPELIGHSGLSGTLAYACPDKELYIAGTVNQVAYPDTSFRLAIKLIQKII